MEQMRIQSSIPWHSTTDILTKHETPLTTTDRLDQVKLTDIPLLQYTSDSTSKSKQHTCLYIHACITKHFSKDHSLTMLH